MINPYRCSCEGSCDFCDSTIYTRKNLAQAWAYGANEVYRKAAYLTFYSVENGLEVSERPWGIIDWGEFEDILRDAQVLTLWPTTK